ncbi:10341_t:CDS:10 [Acaulospora morrowiae]|uniref:10341_t:CDS:1 n=1 Tax=Acaulospora morrowiae TaxID=94023 RepID=A0A9N9GN33_9GLOM|nr:10341_t:CDS:10 [Acaulospora morrowiae]
MIDVSESRPRGRDKEVRETLSYHEKLNMYAVITTMVLYIASVVPICYWRTPDLISSVYLNYFIALAIVFAINICSLCANRVSTAFCAGTIVTNFTIIFYLQVMGSRRIDKNKNTNDFNVGGGGLFLIPLFSYILLGRKFARVTAVFMLLLFAIEAFWPMTTMPDEEMPELQIISLIISILMFFISAAFSGERDILSGLRMINVENQTRKTFLQTISHEIRTPIHGILANSEILCKTPMSSAQYALTLAIQDACMNVFDMADHVLHLAEESTCIMHYKSSLIGVDLLATESEKFDLYLVTERISDGMDILFEVQGVDFDFDYQVPFSQSIYVGVPGAIEKAIINLMGTLLNVFLTGKLLFTVKPRETSAGISDESRVSHLIFEITAAGNLTNTDFSQENYEIKFINTLTNALGGTFTPTFSLKDWNTSTSSITFTIELPMKSGIEECDQSGNVKPLPLRYVKVQAQADVDHLKVDVIRSDEESRTVKRVIAFLNEFEMRSQIYTFHDVIKLDEANTIILDLSGIRVEQISIIFKIAKENDIFVICLTSLLRHVEISEKIELLDSEVYFINKVSVCFMS